MTRFMTGTIFCLALLSVLCVGSVSAQMGAPETSSGVLSPPKAGHVSGASPANVPAHKFMPGPSVRKAAGRSGTVARASVKDKASKLSGSGSSKTGKSLHKKKSPAKKGSSSKKRIGMV